MVYMSMKRQNDNKRLKEIGGKGEQTHDPVSLRSPGLTGPLMLLKETYIEQGTHEVIILWFFLFFVSEVWLACKPHT